MVFFTPTMSELPYPHLEQTLPGFHEARDLIKKHEDSLSSLDFRGDKFEFYRFANRLRLASNFEGLVIRDYDQETTDAYGSLTKLFLTWSTFEMYCGLCDQPYHSMFRYDPKRFTHDLANDYWDYDRDGILIDFLIERSELHGQDHFLKQFADGNNYRAITVAACMRHIYAHGHLTAHPQGLSAEATSKICTLFTHFIGRFIREDFKRRLLIAQKIK